MRDTGAQLNRNELVRDISGDPLKSQQSSARDFFNAPLSFSESDDISSADKSSKTLPCSSNIKAKTSQIASTSKQKTNTAPVNSYRGNFSTYSRESSDPFLLQTSELTKSQRTGYETRFYNLIQNSSESTTRSSGLLPPGRGRSSTISSMTSSRSGIFSRVLSHKSINSHVSGGFSSYSLFGDSTSQTLSIDNSKPKTLKERYLGFLKFSKKNSETVTDSNDFMPPSAASSIGNFAETYDEQQIVPDPILLLERLSKQMENCHWKSPLLTDELFIVDVIFNNDYARALGVIRGISELNINGYDSSTNHVASTRGSISSIGSAASWYSVNDTFSFSPTEDRIGEENESASVNAKTAMPADILNPTPTANLTRETTHSSNSGDVFVDENMSFEDKMSFSTDNIKLDETFKAKAPKLPKKPAPIAIYGNAATKSKLLHKYNSCSTLFTVDSTVYNPPKHPEYLDITLKVISNAIHAHLTRTQVLYQELSNFDEQYRNNNTKYARKVFKSAECLSEKLYPIWNVRKIPDQVLVFPEIMHPPTLEEIFQFLRQVFMAADLTAEVAIITLIYLERMMYRTKVSLFGVNCFRCILGALILASKVWDDQSVWNVDFQTIMCDLGLDDLNSLERWWLRKTKFDVHIKRGLFAKYWFEIRELAEKLYGVKLGNNSVIMNSKDIETKPNADKRRREEHAALFAPAIKHGEESQRRKSKASIDLGILPKPLTENHMLKLSAISSYSQTKLREAISTKFTSTDDVPLDFNMEYSLIKSDKHLDKTDVSKMAIKIKAMQQQKTKTSVLSKDRVRTVTVNPTHMQKHIEYGGSNLRRTKSDNFYNPPVPAASVL